MTMDDPKIQVLVAGGGTCGAVAALAAHAAGAEVLVLEQDAVPRGSTAMSQGLVCAAGTAAPNCQILFTGTSPAAALVAGTAALMITLNPGLTPPIVTQLLEASTDDIHDPKEGFGRLNAQRAVARSIGDGNAQPALPLPRALEFVAFAYTNSGTALPVAPAIVDSTYTHGVHVNQDGTFRIADVAAASLPKGVTSYKIGVWVSLWGDGKVHAGDYFASASCSITSSCSSAIAKLSVTAIPGPNLP